MAKELYPLSVGQAAQYAPIKKTGSQGYANICVFCGLKTKLDFGLLKHAIEDEFKRADCMRIRFTEPDENGDIMQYIVDHDPRDIPYLDLSHMSEEEALAFLQEKSYEEFNGSDIPMVEVTMVSMPGGYDGYYTHIDHRLSDSSGLIVNTNDIIEIYCHYRFGSPYPEPLASFVDVLKKDLKKADNKKRQEKDEAFWREMFERDGEPIYSDIQGVSVLQNTRKRHGDKKLRAADMEMENRAVAIANFHLEPKATEDMVNFCMNHDVSMTNLILLSMRTYLSKVNGGQQDITIRNYISRRSTRAEWTCGGSRTLAYPCRTIITPDTEFLDAAYEVQSVQNSVYMHSNFPQERVDEILQEMYPRPENTTYMSMSLTYQPLPVRVQNEHLADIPIKGIWFPKEASSKKIYLTVSHSTVDGGLIFNYHYQTASLGYDDIELLYYYMMKIIYMGIEEPDLTIGEIIQTV